MPQNHTRAFFLGISFWGFLAATLSLFLTGCGSGFDKGYASYISAPSNVVRAGQSLQLTTESTVTGSPVQFWVNGVLGGDAEVGTISGNGLYTAPAITPSPNNVVTITALATAFPNDTPGLVTVSVLNPIPVIGSVTPSGFTEGTTTVTVSGTQFVYGAQIFWNGVAVPTTFVSDTELAAAIAAPNPGTYPLMVGNPGPGAANSGVVSEVVGPGQVVLTLETNGGTSVRVTNSLSVAINVSGTNNTGVTWLINGAASGNAQIGTIIANPDGSVTYTAPAVVPTPSNIVQLTAVSVDNPAVSIRQNIAVMNPIPVLAAATPMAFNPGPATVVVTGSNFINGAQVLVNGTPAPTTFNSGGQLTASVNAANPGDLDLQVLNPGPGPAASADLIALVNGNPPTLVPSPQDASRFLAQATFGATDGDIRNLSQIGFTAWLNQQVSIPPTLHEPAVEQSLILNNPACNVGDVTCNAALFVQNASDEGYLQQSFWQQALTGSDQLRQRVKYALTELMVISSTNPAVQNMPRGMANYLDVLGADAFGNFRQLLQDVTLNPMMGQFLSVQGNDKGDSTRDPDENYAREVMQLFTIGLYQLNPDGTQVLDASGNAIPTYSNNDVMGLAKVFTGFSWNVPGNTSDTAWSNCCMYVGTGFGEDILPMQSYPNHHSTDEKDFLGVTIPASTNPDPAGDLKIALDTLFNHPNTPPFVCKQLILHLVTSNPSPAYVARVAAVFQNDGTGVRGNMQAVIQAILLDTEARNSSAAAANPQYGKVREALIRYAEWARAFTAQSRNGSFNLGSTEDPIFALGEMSLRSPTVFNWFAPGYVPPATSISAAGLVAPEMEMTDVSTVVGYLNYMQSAIGANAAGGPDVFSSYSAELALAATPDQLLDRINLLLMAGEMDSTLQSEILSAVNSIAVPTSGQAAINAALLARVETAIYLTMASPSYAAQF
ncbi:MAG: DUF1800 family protein [Acidobacteriaceae bacterium]|jgi:uncharacterized protein (DUF1800 family)